MGSRNVRRITRGNVLVKPARNHSDGVYEQKQRQCVLLRYDRDKSGWTQIRGYAPRTVLYGEIEEEISANKVSHRSRASLNIVYFSDNQSKKTSHCFPIKFLFSRLKEKIIHALHIIDAMLWKFAAYHSTYTKHPLQQARLTHQSTAGLSKYFRCLDGDRVRCKTTSDD